SFEKRQVLADVVPRAVRDLEDALASVRGVATPGALTSAQRQFSSVMKRHRQVFAPFVPREALGPLPNDLFASVRDVFDAPDLEFLARYHAAVESLDAASSVSRSHDGRLPSTVLADLVTELRATVDHARN